MQIGDTVHYRTRALERVLIYNWQANISCDVYWITRRLAGRPVRDAVSGFIQGPFAELEATLIDINVNC